MSTAVPEFAERRRGPQCPGFSFIEVLFALFIVSLTALAAGGLVIGALQAEASARQERTTTQLWTTLHARWWLDRSVALDTVTDEYGGRFTSTHVATERADWPYETPPPRWVLHTWHPPAPHRPTAPLAFPAWE